jgi:hypothetical protein
VLRKRKGRRKMINRSESRMNDAEMVAELRREAEDIRAGRSIVWKNFAIFASAEEAAIMCDEYADAVEAGEIVDGEDVEEEETPEQLMAEAEVARDLAEFLERHDAGSLAGLLKRWSLK